MLWWYPNLLYAFVLRVVLGVWIYLFGEKKQKNFQFHVLSCRPIFMMLQLFLQWRHFCTIIDKVLILVSRHHKWAINGSELISTWCYSVNTACEADVLLPWSTKSGVCYATVPAIVLAEEAYSFPIKEPLWKPHRSGNWVCFHCKNMSFHYIQFIHTCIQTHVHTATHSIQKERNISYLQHQGLFFYSIIEVVILALYMIRKVNHASAGMNIHTVYVCQFKCACDYTKENKSKKTNK